MTDANAAIVSDDWTSFRAPSPSGAHALEIDCLEAHVVSGGRRTPTLAGVDGTGGDCPPYQPPIVRFSPDERSVVVAQQLHRPEERSVRVFETHSGRQIAELHHPSFVGAVAFSHDGKLIATGGDDGTARVWNAATGEQLAVLSGHRAGVTGVLFDDGGRVVTASGDGTVRFWDPLAGLPLVFAGDGAGISADGAHVATARTGDVRVWRSEDGAPVIRLRGPRGEPTAVGVANDGSIVVVDGEAFDTKTKKRIASFDPGLNLSLSADALWALATQTELWNVRAGRRAHYLGADRLDELGVFSDDNELVVAIGAPDVEVGSASDDVRVWEVATGKLRHRVTTTPELVLAAAISPDKKLVAAGVTNGVVNVWDTATWTRVARTPAHSATITALAFAPGSDLLISTDDDGTARVWEPRTGNLVTSLAGHEGVVQTAAFSPDGTLVVTGGADRTVRVWDSATGENLLVLRATAAVERAAFATGGRFVVAALANGDAARYSCDACASTEVLLERAEDRITRLLTADEQRRYLHRQSDG